MKTKFPKKLKVCAEWTDDCCGKKDYDGRVLSVSTRYWPRGGGMLVVHNTGGKVRIEDDSARPEIKPSARASIGFPTPDTDHLELIAKDFEADSFEEVKAQVETWVNEQVQRAYRALREEFP